jgi:DDE family transposase
LLLDALLQRCRARQLLKARGRQRTDSTHVLGAIRALNRVECVGETLRHALNSLAVVAPEWLQKHSHPEWIERYGPRVAASRLPSSKAAQASYVQTVGRDGAALLAAVYAPEAPAWLREVPAFHILQRVWVQQYYTTADTMQWRTETEGLPPARIFLSSPYDVDAHLARKETTQWIGYKVHLTESCDDDRPRLITHVATTAGPIADGAVTPTVHQALQEKQLLPATHLVDTGYLDAELLATSWRDYGVELLGPTRSNYRWQARAQQGFAADSFHIDWERHQAHCPAGRTSLNWTPLVDKHGNEVVQIRFAYTDCHSCPTRTHCTRGARRIVTVRRHEHYTALQAAQQREASAEYKRQYAQRAGIEGTISQGMRRCRLRRTRYMGLAKTHLQHLLTATALNFVRLSNWLAGTPLATTRRSSFVKLMRPLTTP